MSTSKTSTDWPRWVDIVYHHAVPRKPAFANTLATALMLILSSTAHAQNSDSDSIIVTATRLDVSEDEAVLQIPKDALSLSTLEALEGLPGVTTFRNGGAGGSSFLSIRGGEPNFTLVLFDGIRLNDSTNSAGGAFDFSQIDPVFIGRLEIDRGTGSAIHGSDALSGVVNIITPSPTRLDAPSWDLRGTVQTEEAYALSGLATHQWRHGGVSFGAARRDSGSLTDDSTLRRDSALLRLDQSIGEGTLSLSAYHAQTDRTAYAEDSGGTLAPAGPVLEDKETTLKLLGLGIAQPLSGKTVLHAALNVSEQSAFSNIPAIPAGVFDAVPARIDDTELRRWEGQTFLRSEIRPDWRIVFGLGYALETGQGDGILDIGFPLETRFSERREIASGFIETAAQLSPQLNIEGALRFDANNVSDDRTTYKVGARYRLSDSVQLRTGHSISYKLPSVFATSYPLIANPDLEPEISRNFEAGIIVEDDRIGRFEATAHQTRFRNLIDFDPQAFTNVNRKSVSSRGLELMWETSLTERLSLSSALTLSDVDTPSDQPLRNRPKVSAQTHISYQVSPSWLAYTQWQSSSKRFGSSVPTGFIKLDGFQTLDFGLLWSPRETLQLRLDFVNGFDANYSQAVGVREFKRHLSLSLNQSF